MGGPVTPRETSISLTRPALDRDDSATESRVHDSRAPSVYSRAPSSYSISDGTRPLIDQGDVASHTQASTSRFRRLGRVARKSLDWSSKSVPPRPSLQTLDETFVPAKFAAGADTPALDSVPWGSFKTLEGTEENIHAAGLSPDGSLVASVLDEKTVRLWSAVDLVEIKRLGHVRLIKGIAFSPDGALLATITDMCHLRIWDLSTWIEITQDRIVEGGRATQLEFSRDGQLLASGGLLFDTTTWDPIQGPTNAVARDEWTTATFSEHGRLVALHSSGLVPTIRFWDTRRGQMSDLVVQCDAPIYFVAFSADGQSFATSTFKHIQIWDLSPTGASSSLRAVELQKLQSHNTPLAFSPNGKYLVFRKSGELWYANPSNMAPVQKTSLVKRQTVYLNGLQFSHDGRMLVVTLYEALLGLKAWDIFLERLPLPAAVRPDVVL